MKRSALFMIILEVVLATSVCLNVLFYTEMASNMHTADQAQFNKQFGQVSIDSLNYAFSPPISMYKALMIAFESDGWNSTSLQNVLVSVSLDYREFYNSNTGSGAYLIDKVTQPVQFYGNVQVNSTTVDRYVWDIQISLSGTGFYHSFALYYVDAQTGIIIPHAPLY